MVSGQQYNQVASPTHVSQPIYFFIHGSREEIGSSEAILQLILFSIFLRVGSIGRMAPLLGINRAIWLGVGWVTTLNERRFGCKQVLVKPHGTRFHVVACGLVRAAGISTSSELVTGQLVLAACPGQQ